MSEQDIQHAGRPSRRFVLGGVVIVCVAIGLGVAGTMKRLQAHAALADHTEAKIGLTVATHTVKASAKGDDVVLPGTAKAYTDSPVYARTSGYLKRWLFDIGAEVKADDLLAEIDTPEIDQQLRQAEADAATAAANEKLAQITAARYRTLLASHVVPKQDADEKFADADAKRAALEAAHANVQRLQELERFKFIRAPFAGIITARKVDIGDLINAGGAATQLFQLAALDKLRVYVQVPQTYAQLMQLGLEAAVGFADRPGSRVQSKLVRSASAIDPTARTLLCEFEVDNRERKLLPGAYVEVHIKMPVDEGTVKLPAAAIMFRTSGPNVARLEEGGTVKIVPVALGRDFGTEIEVRSGVAAGQRVVMNPPDFLDDGMRVNVQAAAAEPAAKH